MGVTPRIECKQFVIENVASLKPHPSNSNKHPQRQIEALAKIIARNGQRSPIVVSTLSGFIVKGHGRLKAIELLGWDTCAVEYQDYNDEVEELRDRIADNEIARYAEFDKQSFLDELQESGLDTTQVDMEEFGLLDFEEEKFSEVDLPDMKGEDPDIQQMTFILSNDQADKVNDSVSSMIKSEFFIEDAINTNTRGTALALICEKYGH